MLADFLKIYPNLMNFNQTKIAYKSVDFCEFGWIPHHNLSDNIL